MQQGLLGRISRSCIMEYHAFGIISEGTHAKYHFMICGVQGDFTRSLVNDPPATLWTRELKVSLPRSGSIKDISFINISRSLLAFRTRLRCTSEVSVFAQVPVSERRCQHAFKAHTGSSSGSEAIKRKPLVRPSLVSSIVISDLKDYCCGIASRGGAFLVLMLVEM